MLGHRLLIATQPGKRPGASRVSVGHGFQRGKGFGRYDKQRFRRIEIAYRFREVSAIDIGNEAEGHISLAVVLESFIGHDRPEIGAANADVHDVTNALTSVTCPRAASDAVRKISHLVEYRVDLRDHVLSIDEDACVLRRTKRHMQNRALFRDVYLVSAKHGVESRAQAGLIT